MLLKTKDLAVLSDYLTENKRLDYTHSSREFRSFFVAWMLGPTRGAALDGASRGSTAGTSRAKALAS